ncbi:MAG: AsmA family protein [Alphaproteobacteria bacterium]|nr:AsmA family protein [Alphaproteobacteria bacterium]
MGRFIKILGGILAVVVVISVGAVVYVLNIDLNDWKPEIQSAVKDATGRTLVIQGPIEFELGTDTRLKATGISLSNADWGSRPNMVEVDSVEVSLKLFSLLGSTPDITLAHVDGVRAIVEKNQQGVSNTEFKTAEAEDGKSDDKESHSSDDFSGDGELTLPIIRDLRIADVEVVMKDPAVGPDRVFTLTELTLGSQSETDPLKLNLDAAFDDLDLVMSGSMGSLQTMTDSSQPTPVDFVGNLAGIDVAIQGQIQDLAGQEGIDVKVSALGDELANVAQIAGIDVPRLGGFKVDATLKGDGDDLSVNPLVVDMGTADVIHVTVNGTIKNAVATEGVDLAVKVNSKQVGNLSPIAEKFSGQKVPALGPLDISLNIRGDLADELSVEDLSLNLGTKEMIALVVNGGIKDIVKQNGIALDIAANSPELGNLSPIAKEFSGQSIPKMGPLSMTAKVAGGMESGLGLTDLAMDMGKPETIQVQVNGGVADLLAQKGVELSVKAVSPEVGNLSPLVKAFTSVAVPALGPLNLNLKVAGDAQDVMTLSQLDLELGTEKTLLVEAKGTVTDLVKLSGADVSFKVVSPNLSVLSDLAPGIPPIGPVDVSGSLKGDNGKPITLDPFTAKIGGSDIAGTATIDATGDVPKMPTIPHIVIIPSMHDSCPP